MGGGKMDVDQLDDFDDWFGSIHEKKEPSGVGLVSDALKVVHAKDEDELKRSSHRKRSTKKSEKLGSAADKLMGGQSLMDSRARERSVHARARTRVQTQRAEKQNGADQSNVRRRRTRESINRFLDNIDEDAEIVPISKTKSSKTKDRTKSLDDSRHRGATRDPSGSSSLQSRTRRHSVGRDDELGSGSQHSRRSRTSKDDLGPASHHSRRSATQHDLGRTSQHSRHHDDLSRSSQHSRKSQATQITAKTRKSNSSDDCSFDFDDDCDGLGCDKDDRSFQAPRIKGSSKGTPPMSPDTNSSSTHNSRSRQIDKRYNNSPNKSRSSPNKNKLENNLTKMIVSPSPFDDKRVIVEMDKDTLSKMLAGAAGIVEEAVVQSPRQGEHSRTTRPSETKRSSKTSERARQSNSPRARRTGVVPRRPPGALPRKSTSVGSGMKPPTIDRQSLMRRAGSVPRLEKQTESASVHGDRRAHMVRTDSNRTMTRRKTGGLDKETLSSMMGEMQF